MSTRPEPGTPEELIWLRGFEAGVVHCAIREAQSAKDSEGGNDD